MNKEVKRRADVAGVRRAADLAAGVRRPEATANDGHGRALTDRVAFKVVEELPDFEGTTAFEPVNRLSERTKIRVDGPCIEASENDNLIVSRLASDPDEV